MNNKDEKYTRRTITLDNPVVCQACNEQTKEAYCACACCVDDAKKYRTVTDKEGNPVRGPIHCVSCDKQAETLVFACQSCVQDAYKYRLLLDDLLRTHYEAERKAEQRRAKK